MADHRTSNLKISGERVPEVEKLQNGRYRLEFRCTGFSREDWFSENVDGSIFASLGSLMNSEMEIDGLGGSESLEGEAYDDMRLIENRLEYTPSGNLVVYFRYETLGDTFANEVNDVVDYTTSGLRRVTRVLIAKDDTSYSKEVGVDSISHSVGAGGTLTLPLAGYRIEDNNAYRRVTETWVEEGILAVNTPLVGGQQTVEVQAIGLTEAEVGTLLSEVTASHVLISQSKSDYDGLLTTRYTYEVNSFDVLSASDNGLKLLTRTELATGAFNRATVGTTTYSSLILAGEEIDNGNTIKKRVSRWVEKGVLSVSQNFKEASTIVTVQAIGLNQSQVKSTLSEVTSSHKLISEQESDYEGLKTTSYIFELESYDLIATDENGLRSVARDLILAAGTAYTKVVGTTTISHQINGEVAKTLYLAKFKITDTATYRVVSEVWSEAGILSIKPVFESSFNAAPSYIYVTTGAPASSISNLVKPDGTALGSVVTWLEPSVVNVEGFPTYTQEVLTIDLPDNDEVLVHSIEDFFQITDAGVMSTGYRYVSNNNSGTAVVFPEATSQPKTYRKKATVDVYLTDVATTARTEVAYTEENINWCSMSIDTSYVNDEDKTASISANWRSFANYLNSAGATQTAFAEVLGSYTAESNSVSSGSLTQVTAGIYRVTRTEYSRKLDGTPLYLLTVITFA